LNAANRLVLDGTLTARDALRHTPAGIALVSFVLAHESTQAEAGEARQVHLEVNCVAVEEIARVVSASPLGARVQAAGFLAPRARSSRTPVLHVTELEFKQGD
jgi:primosomal replication protein N